MEIIETREKYDAAQTYSESSVIYDIENKTRQKLRELKYEFEQSIKDLVGELKK